MFSFFSRQHDLTRGPVCQTMILFAIPILLGSLFQQLYSTVDAIMVGRFAGEAAFAAIDAVFNLTKLPTQVFIGLASAAAILISRSYGAGDNEAISRLTHCALTFGLFSGIAGSALMMLSLPWFLDILNIPENIYRITREYTQIYFIGMSANIVYALCMGIFQALGSSGRPFFFLLLSNALNIALDYLFLRIIPLGVQGAAAATVVSQTAACALILLTLVKSPLPCRLSARKLSLCPAELGAILRLGLPIAIQAALYPLANMMLQSAINRFGTASIAAWAVCGKMDFLIWLISGAMGTSTLTFVAQNIGANKKDRIRSGIFTALSLTVLFIGLLALILYQYSAVFAGIFVTDKGIIQLARRMIRLIAFAYPAAACATLLCEAIKGSGQSFYPMLLTLLSTCVLRVVWAYAIIRSDDSVFAVLSAYPLSWIVGVLVFGVYAWRRFHTQINLIQTDSET